MNRGHLSVIIPIFNEEKGLPGLFERLKDWESSGREGLQIIFSVSRSSDRSLDLVLDFVKGRKNFESIELEARLSPARACARAIPMAKHPYVFILPADCELSSKSLESLLLSLRPKRWGGFKKQYQVGGVLLRAYAFLQNQVRTKWLKNLVWTNGVFFDRSLLVDSSLYHDFLGDVILSDFFRKNYGSSFCLLEGPILVSPRRYLAIGELRTIFLNLLILMFYRLGWANPQKLQQIYVSSLPKRKDSRAKAHTPKSECKSYRSRTDEPTEVFSGRH